MNNVFFFLLKRKDKELLPILGTIVYNVGTVLVFVYNDVVNLCSGIFEVNFSKDIKIQGVLGPCSSLEKVSIFWRILSYIHYPILLVNGSKWVKHFVWVYRRGLVDSKRKLSKFFYFSITIAVSNLISEVILISIII